jgi:hypothetical protein
VEIFLIFYIYKVFTITLPKKKKELLPFFFNCQRVVTINVVQIPHTTYTYGTIAEIKQDTITKLQLWINFYVHVCLLVADKLWPLELVTYIASWDPMLLLHSFIQKYETKLTKENKPKVTCIIRRLYCNFWSSFTIGNFIPPSIKIIIFYL